MKPFRHFCHPQNLRVSAMQNNITAAWISTTRRPVYPIYCFTACGLVNNDLHEGIYYDFLIKRQTTQLHT
jgi:hypothetical protein